VAPLKRRIVPAILTVVAGFDTLLNSSMRNRLAAVERGSWDGMGDFHSRARGRSTDGLFSILGGVREG
jgi:hypothetical protein